MPDDAPGPATTYSRVMSLLDNARVVPRLFVFDLDYTLWPCYCECERKHPSLYPDVPDILAALRAKGVSMAVASRSPTAKRATTFLDQLNVLKYFEPLEIYSTYLYKDEHFAAIKKKTGVPLSEMLFFDDEHDNIFAARKQGTASVLVDDGVTFEALRQGLEMYADQHENDRGY